MKYIVNLIKLFIIIFIVSILLNTLSYFNIINEKVLFIIQYIVLYFTIFVLSYYLGKSKEQKGYIEGIIFGIIIIVSFALLRIIIFKSFNINNLFNYLLIICVSTIGSIFGINKKTKT